MYQNFPLDVDLKTDSPKRLSLLNGVPEKYFVSSEEFNKIISGLEELYEFQRAHPKTTGTLFFDKKINIHGTAATPITTNLAIDTTNIIEGAVVEVVWSGSVNPNITGVPAADIVNFGPDITTSGIYSIFITYTGGKFKVNIQQPVTYVGNGDALPDPDTPPAGNQPPPTMTIDSAVVVSGGNTAPPTLTIDSVVVVSTTPPSNTAPPTMVIDSATEIDTNTAPPTMVIDSVDELDTNTAPPTLTIDSVDEI